MQQTAAPLDDQPASVASQASSASARSRPGGDDRLLSPRTMVSFVGGVVLTASLVAALLLVGLFVAPTVGLAAYPTTAQAQRPPIIPPSVPEGAREDWAVWSYVDKINQAWGRDWTHVIEWFEDLDARYPNNPMVFDKLYVAYIEAGRTLEAHGDLEGARRRYEQAARYDPSRGVAQDFLEDLDKQPAPRR